MKFVNILKENIIEKIAPELHAYNKEKFQKDMNAGIITGIVAIPLSLALAIASGVPPIFGLYTAAVAGLIAALFAGARFNVSGPAAAMVPLLSSVVNQYGLELLPVIGIIAGVFLIIMGIFKLGSLIEYVPVSVTLGFTAGIAFLLFFGQINNFLGIDGAKRHEYFLENFYESVKNINSSDMQTAVIGIISLALLLLVPKIKSLSKVPASVFVVIFSILAVLYIPFFQNVLTIEDKYGQLVSGLPNFKLISLRSVRDLSGPSLQIAFLIAVESLLCAVVADRMTKTRHLPNQELIAQGIANILSPFFSSIPSTAVIARTGNSIKSNAQSRIAAIVHSLFVMIFIAVLAGIGGKIPLTALSAILFITAWKISEFREIRQAFLKAPKSDIGVLTLAFFLTVFLDLTVAVGIGMFLSAIFIFSKLSTVNLEVLNEHSDYISEDIKNILRKNPAIKFINLEGNLTMGTSQSLIDKISAQNGYETLVLRFREIDHIDLSGLEALSDMLDRVKENNKKVIALSINTRIFNKFKKFGMVSKFDESYKTSKDFIESYK